MNNWNKLASEESINKAVGALKENGIDSLVVGNGAEAKEKLVELLPKGAQVMTMSSVTLDAAGITQEVNESGNYDSVKAKLSKMDRNTQGQEMQKIGAAPAWAIGSVHALTQDGKLLIASNTGSQLGAYAYSAAHVVWVVGTQKIVKDFDEGVKRIYEYVLGLESERVKKVLGMQKSNVSKMLVINKEIKPGRATVIFVKEIIGF